MNLLNVMLRQCRLDEFISEVVNMHNEEYKDKMLWDIWLHKVYDKSYAEFSSGLDENKHDKPTDEEVAGIVEETKNILTHFSTE